MKPITSLVFILSLFVTSASFSQNQKTIEADLLRYLNKINYWGERERSDTLRDDSLGEANDALNKRLEYYRNVDTSIINPVFRKLGNGVSDDGLVRIFSWDTQMGGGAHAYASVIQYRTGQNAVSLADVIKDSGDYVYGLDSLFTLKVGNKTFYLITFDAILHLYERGEGLRLFTIKNGNLVPAKIIKTKSGLTDRLYYQYYRHHLDSDIIDAGIIYDTKRKMISFPLVAQNKFQTGDQITYRFTGQYFEKVTSKK